MLAWYSNTKLDKVVLPKGACDNITDIIASWSIVRMQANIHSMYSMQHQCMRCKLQTMVTYGTKLVSGCLFQQYAGGLALQLLWDRSP